MNSSRKMLDMSSSTDKEVDRREAAKRAESAREEMIEQLRNERDDLRMSRDKWRATAEKRTRERDVLQSSKSVRLVRAFYTPIRLVRVRLRKRSNG